MKNSTRSCLTNSNMNMDTPDASDSICFRSISETSSEPQSCCTFPLETSHQTDPNEIIQDGCLDGHSTNYPSTDEFEDIKHSPFVMQPQKCPQGSALSSTSPSKARRMELLKQGSPKSRALESLRQRIQQQRQVGKAKSPANGLNRRDHATITRKVCRVAFSLKGAREVLGTAKVIRSSAKRARPSSSTGCHPRPAARAASHTECLTIGGHSTYISAWRDAQKLVKPILGSNKMHLSSQTPKENTISTRTADQIDRSSERTHKSKVVAPHVQKCQNDSKLRPNLKIQDGVFIMTNRSPKHFKGTSHKIPSASLSGHGVGLKTRPGASIPEGKENGGPTRPSKALRHNAQEVREYMSRQVSERRRKELQRKKEAEQEEEKRKKSVQEVLRRQREALQRATKEHSNESKEKKCSNITPDQRELANPHAEGALQVHSISDAQDEAGTPLRLADLTRKNCLAWSQRQRVEALRKTIAALDTRMENEAIRMGITEQISCKRAPGPTGPLGPRSDEDKTRDIGISDSVRHFEDLKKKVTDDKIDVGACAPEMPHRSQGKATSVSEQSDSTDSTSKWSELSELFSQGQLQCQLSLAQTQQFLREEELRARQCSALFRLREKALWEKTQAELAWLDLCKRNLRAEEDRPLADIKMKQEEVVFRLQQEQAEIHHWRNVYKSGRQQRKLLLEHQRDVLDIQRSAAQLKRVLQHRSATGFESNQDRHTERTLEGKRSAREPGLLPDASARDKQLREEKRFLTKAGLRRLSEDVWSFGRRRNSVELAPAEQDILQTAGANELSHPGPSLRYFHQSRPLPQNVNHERHVETEDGKSSNQCDTVKTNESQIQEQEAKIKEQRSSHLGLQEDVSPPRSNEQLSGDKPLSSAELPWKPLKNVHSFASPQDIQAGTATSERATPASNFSSDIDEDLPFDSEDSKPRPEEHGSIKSCGTLGDVYIDCAKAMTDTVTLNVQNNQRSQSVSSFNNNHESDGEPEEQWLTHAACTGTDKIVTDTEIAGQMMWPNTQVSIADNTFSGASVQDAGSADMKNSHESPSTDTSQSESEDTFEPLSFSSGLASSEEENDVKDEGRASSLVYTEQFPVVRDHPPYHQPNTKLNRGGPFTLPYYEKQMPVESTLSEILSPVDEVLSYGSADLPPSVKGCVGSGPNSNSLPPPLPAYEVITWTSEEEFLAPPEEHGIYAAEDPSITSEHLPPLPSDWSLPVKRTESSGHKDVVMNDDEANGDLCRTCPPAESICEDEEENDCSEYTGSLPADEKHDRSDALSSFHIGDRVLVCHSRPGVLKFKGLTTFAGGLWAGVALDMPKGNHNGTFRGVMYFKCDKNCGVLVRAEDISHLRREGSDLDTGVDEDPFSDEEPPDGSKSRRKRGKGDKASGRGPEGNRHRCQDPPGENHSAPNRTCKHELHKNSLHIYRNLSDEIPGLSSCSPSTKKSAPKIDFDLSLHTVEHKVCGNDSDFLVELLTEEIIKDVVTDAQETRKRHRQKMRSLMEDNKSMDTDWKKREDSYFTSNKPCLIDQWHYTHYPATIPKVQVQPHDRDIVYRLVDAAVEALCDKAENGTVDNCEAPSYLVDDESRKGYRQVLFKLTSDIFHEVWTDLVEPSGSLHKTQDGSVLSSLLSSKLSLTDIKAVVKKEIQKVLNLERTDQQMKEMLQTLCKYWYAKRDKVDYILIQELHREEKQWVDYSSDQITVKIRLAEEIFSLLLEDTISVVNQMYLSRLNHATN